MISEDRREDSFRGVPADALRELVIVELNGENQCMETERKKRILIDLEKLNTLGGRGVLPAEGVLSWERWSCLPAAIGKAGSIFTKTMPSSTRTQACTTNVGIMTGTLASLPIAFSYQGSSGGLWLQGRWIPKPDRRKLTIPLQILLWPPCIPLFPSGRCHCDWRPV